MLFFRVGSIDASENEFDFENSTTTTTTNLNDSKLNGWIFNLIKKKTRFKCE